MRVRFGELSTQERQERDDVVVRARSAWSQLRDGDAAAAKAAMDAIDPRVELSVVRADRDGRGDVVALAELTALESSAWPLAELILAQAPTDVGCALALGRGAQPLAPALREVKASHGVDFERATLRAGFGRGHLLEITLAVPGGAGGEKAQNAAENLVRALLGDRLFETWIGAVHVTPAPRGGPLRVLDVSAPRSGLGLHELFDTVAAATLGVLRGLPESTFERAARTVSVYEHVAAADSSSSREEWTLLEVEPLADARGERKDDLVLASTSTPELLRCYLDGSPCASRRFARDGVVFVYLSYVDDELRMSRRVARRTQIENALSECLRDDGVVTGVGLGVKTTYVDLGLCHLETGLPRLVSKLRGLELPRRSFLQFFDSELAEEWLSIWPDTRITEE